MTIQELKPYEEDIKQMEGTHEFLAEDILLPHLNKCDTTRINLFTSYITQAQILADGDFPKVYSGFENQVGQYSSSGFIKIDDDYEVIGKVYRNKMNYTLLLHNKEKDILHCVDITEAENITENFGYINDNTVANELIEGSKVKKDTVISRNGSYDEHMNLQYGANIPTAYMAYKELTHEDALVISETARTKLSTHSVVEFEFKLNSNDILLNLYGNSEEYKTFPDIGEDIKDNILLGFRRLFKNTMFFDLQDVNLMNLFETDKILYEKGTVCDIQIFSNQTFEELSKYKYNHQILHYIEMQEAYHNKIVSILEEAGLDIEKGNYTSDLAYKYKRSKSIIDPNMRWKNENTDFDNIIMRFKIARFEPVVIGSKLSNRYGGKGVVSAILKDEEMPRCEIDGTQSHLISNSLGVINRLNSAQLFEHEINATSRIMEDRLRIMFEEAGSITKEMEDLLFEYMRCLSVPYRDKIKEVYEILDDNGFQEFWEGILYGGGIYVEQAPMYGNVDILGLFKIFDEFGIDLKSKLDGIENEIIVGEVYFMTLRHHPQGKFTGRSGGYTDQKLLPSKSMAYSKKEAPHQSTAIRMGEMEINNMFIIKDIRKVVDMLSMYSTNSADREKMTTELLTRNPFDIDEITITDEVDRTSDILDVILKGIGIEMAVIEEE